MIRSDRASLGWRFALLVASAWIGLVMVLYALDARADDSPRADHLAGHRMDQHAEEDAGKHKRRESRVERWNEASRKERRQMREAARDFWDDATPRDRKRMRRRVDSLRKALPEFSKIERRMILRRTLEMPRKDRDALRDRIMRIEQLDAAERGRLEAELRGLIDDPSDEMYRIEKNARRWQEMSPEKRDEMREQARRFRGLPLEDRKRLLDEWVPSEKSPNESSD